MPKKFLYVDEKVCINPKLISKIEHHEITPKMYCWGDGGATVISTYMIHIYVASDTPVVVYQFVQEDPRLRRGGYTFKREVPNPYYDTVLEYMKSLK